MGLRNAVLVGFSIRDRVSFEAACLHTNGAIIGTAYIRALENVGAAGDAGAGAADIAGATQKFLSTILT